VTQADLRVAGVDRRQFEALEHNFHPHVVVISRTRW
jgi:hypothetical protein